MSSRIGCASLRNEPGSWPRRAANALRSPPGTALHNRLRDVPRLERNILIRAAADRVWRVLVDPMQAPDWEAGLVALEDVGGMLDEAAASCTQLMNFRGRTLQGELEVVEAFP